MPLYSDFAEWKAKYEADVVVLGRAAADEDHNGPPNPAEYMPEWPETEKTMIMMYETCSEGTPISPAFETPEELARWLTDNEASAFGRFTATYEQWLDTCRRGWAVGAVATPGHGFESGVAAAARGGK